MSNLDSKLRELADSGVPFCVSTIVKVTGSSPRHVGAKMLVTADESFGTVGGGDVEYQAMRDARELLRRRRSECITYEMTPESCAQLCGGIMDIFHEVVVPPRPVIVFGAGHIGEALCPMLPELGYDVTLVDDRKERLALPAFANIKNRVEKNPADFLPTMKFFDDLHIICFTHHHKYDEQIVEHCLDKPFRYLGLISSRAKWKILRERYRKKGFTDEQFGRVSTPIGLDIGAETPFEIAVAIAAELVKLTKEHISHYTSNFG